MAGGAGAAIQLGSTLEVAHVGDARVWRFAAGVLQPLTRDHRLVEDLLAAGMIRPDEMKTHLHHRVLTRGVGMRVSQPLVEAKTVDAQPGEVILLSTKGLHDHVEPEPMQAVLQRGGPLDAMADALLALAVTAGDRDNATAVLVRL